MNSYRRFAALLGLLSLSAATLFAQGPKQQKNGSDYWHKIEKLMGAQTRYSVDMEMQAMGMSMVSKTYRLDNRTRTETTMPFMNLRMVMLELEENGKNVSYSLFPDKKKYCVDPEDDGDQDAASGNPDFKVTEAGTEVFEGIVCKKRHVTMKDPDGASQEIDILVSPKQKNMPVKMTATSQVEAEPGQPPMTIVSVVLFKNYVFGAPAASLFVIPKDYTRAASMSEVMMGGFMMPQQGSGQAAGTAGQPNLADLIRQAQQEAAADAAEDAKAEAENEAAAPAQNLQQSLQALRGLLGQ